MVKPGKTRLNVVVIGHVDSGKSTTTGQLLLQCGNVDKRTIEKYEKEANEKGKGSFKFAWVLDRNQAERDRGITIDNTLVSIETENNSISLCDAPGHRDFMKNMITGTSAADCAILIIPASAGEGETAISKEGSAREHATLCMTLGVKRIMVGINKMDACDYSETRYNELVRESKLFLGRIGYQEAGIAFIPISGFCGDNILTLSTNMPWFTGWSYDTKNIKGDMVTIKGKSLYDWLNTLPEVARPVNKPLRIPLGDCFKIQGAGTVPVGRVESGTLKPNDMVYVSPSNVHSEVKSIEMHHTVLDVANPGDNIGFNLKNVAVTDLKRGFVVGHSKNEPPRECADFTAQVVAVKPIGKDTGFHDDYTPVMDCHTSHLPTRFKKIVCRVDKRSGKVIPEEDPNARIAIKNGEAGIVEMEPKLPSCVEAFSEFPSLGRFALRDSRQTVGVGIIKSVNKKEPGTKGAPKDAAKGGAKAGGAQKAAPKAKK